MPIPREIIDEIRARTSIAEVIGKSVALTRTGTSLKGLCPFHGEKTPSFNVNEGRNMWHCFGCGEGGDVFAFVMKQENRTFMEVVEELGERAGIAIPKAPLTREQEEKRSESEEMFFVNERAKAFFTSTLASPAGKAAREYLKKRGIGSDIIEEFGLGYCGPGWDALASWFRQNKLDPRAGVKAGLFTPRRQGDGFYDRFHERLTFTIANYRGRVVGFGGRQMDGPTTQGEGSPKYLNSSESPVYKKSEIMYGLDTARAAIGKHDRVIVVEGYFDLLGLAQAGIREVVATCGTALTPGHLEILRRYTKKVILLYDGDEAGRKAAVRSLPLFIESGMTSLYCPLPDGEDPDTTVMRVGVEAFQKRLSGAESVAEFYIERMRKTSEGKSTEERAELLKRIAPIFWNVSDPVMRDHYSSKLSFALELPQEMVINVIALKGAPPPKPNENNEVAQPLIKRPDFKRAGGAPWKPGRKWNDPPPGPPTADLPVAAKLRTTAGGNRNSEETVLRLMLGSRKVAARVRADRILGLFKDRNLCSLGEKIAEAVLRDSRDSTDSGTEAEPSDQPDVGAVLDAVDFSETERRLITQLSVSPLPSDETTVAKTFEDVRLQLEQRELSSRLKALKAEMAAAQRAHDDARVMALSQEVNEVNRRLKK